jgi:hypothetical protein
MGIFSFFKVAGITYDGAKASEPFWRLARVVSGDDSRLPKETILVAANMMLDLYRSHKVYFDKGLKAERVNAVKFLVAFTSYCVGRDGLEWDWVVVRDHARGLYTSMEETPAHFLHYNTPLIESVVEELTAFLRA